MASEQRCLQTSINHETNEANWNGPIGGLFADSDQRSGCQDGTAGQLFGQQIGLCVLQLLALRTLRHSAYRRQLPVRAGGRL